MWCPVLCFHSTLRSVIMHTTTIDLIAMVYIYLKLFEKIKWPSHERSSEKTSDLFSDNLLSADLQCSKADSFTGLITGSSSWLRFLFLAANNDQCLCFCGCLSQFIVVFVSSGCCTLTDCKSATAWLPSYFIQAHLDCVCIYDHCFAFISTIYHGYSSWSLFLPL